MQDRARILGISGSLRQASYNSALLRAARDLAPAGAQIEIFDLSDIPFYNGDVESSGLPEPVARLAEAVRTANALLIVTPEYNHSVPAVLKNAIDWISRPSAGNPLRHKPIALLGASGGQYGTVRAQSHLRQIFASAIEAYVMIKPDLFVNNAASKIDADGNVTDEETRQRIAAHVEALVAWSRLVSREPVAGAAH
ncbi:MAG TPA: NADPH-dependent FMN reductase [Thermomicrobiales bacterium]|nr:NADPH-dependent FMN reductase [Thermomicrobiales bacterium]